MMYNVFKNHFLKGLKIGKAEKSEMSEMLEQTLKLFQLGVFVFALCAISEKSEMSEQGLSPFNSVNSDCKMRFLQGSFRCSMGCSKRASGDFPPNFGFCPYAINEKSEISEQGIYLPYPVFIKMPLF